ncbi:MAG: DNA repair protein RecN [Pseudomonadota bacterium]
MLVGLHVRDFVLIDQASLPLRRGLTALTGETGAGKSILLDAIGLAVGGRANRGAVRAGAARGSVSATFEPGADHAIWAVLREADLPAEDDMVILRRVQEADGKSRAFVNDTPVSVQRLREIGDCLMEIHGQHDGRGLLTASTHRALLDEFGGCAPALQAVRASWRDVKKARAAFDERETARRAAAAEADFLRHASEELTTLGPAAGEEAALAARRQEMMSIEKARADLAAAAAALGEDGADDRIAVAARRLNAAAGFFDDGHAVNEAASGLDRALCELAEARATVVRLVDEIDLDTDEQDAVEDRLHALRAAARKYGVAVDGLADYREKIAAALNIADEDEANLKALRDALEASEAAYARAAADLSKARGAAAKRLDAAVARELKPLKLERAVFSTQVDKNDGAPGPDGLDHIEFMVATNPGAPAGPLKTIASGGELSRFILAMKAALAAKECRTVIIFDEIDAGVGGAVADAVGERLAALARDAQVLVVTHSPQVAARADWHWRVEKKQTAKRTTTRIEPLEEAARIEEIARMLSGARITDEARAAARRLLGSDPEVAAAPRARRKKSA